MRPMKFAIFGNTYQAKKSTHVERLLSILDRHRAEVYICREFYQFLTDDLKLQIRQAGVFEGNDFEADMVLSIGGDGTFLKAASRVGSRNISILGINTGRLGFLADVSPEEMEDTFNDIYSNNYRIEDRSVLQVSCKEQELKGYPFGLNEIAVLKRDSSSMISIHTAINGDYLTTYQAPCFFLSITPRQLQMPVRDLSLSGFLFALPLSPTLEQAPVRQAYRQAASLPYIIIIYVSC